jgi:hypothetical protein
LIGKNAFLSMAFLREFAQPMFLILRDLIVLCH